MKTLKNSAVILTAFVLSFYFYAYSYSYNNISGVYNDDGSKEAASIDQPVSTQGCTMDNCQMEDCGKSCTTGTCTMMKSEGNSQGNTELSSDETKASCSGENCTQCNATENMK